VMLGLSQTAQGILWYYEAWKNRDNDISRMCTSLKNLTATLNVLLETIKPPAAFDSKVKDNVENCIKTFDGSLKELKTELENIKDTEPPNPRVRAALRRHVRRALYPFKEATLVKIQTLRMNLVGGRCCGRPKTGTRL